MTGVFAALAGLALLLQPMGGWIKLDVTVLLLPLLLAALWVAYSPPPEKV